MRMWDLLWVWSVSCNAYMSIVRKGWYFEHFCFIFISWTFWKYNCGNELSIYDCLHLYWETTDCIVIHILNHSCKLQNNRFIAIFIKNVWISRLLKILQHVRLHYFVQSEKYLILFHVLPSTGVAISFMQAYFFVQQNETNLPRSILAKSQRFWN